jgi:hypothetical protein
MKEFIMNKITKKTAFGLTGAAAATLMVAGFAAPAMADDTTSSWDYSTTSTSTSLADLFRVGDVSNDSPVVLAPSVDTGDLLSGNALASGNDVSAPVASGNDTAISDIGNVSDIGNGTSVSGGDIGTQVDDLVDGGNIGTNVDNLVGDILADLGIEE